MKFKRPLQINKIKICAITVMALMLCTALAGCVGVHAVGGFAESEIEDTKAPRESRKNSDTKAPRESRKNSDTKAPRESSKNSDTKAPREVNENPDTKVTKKLSENLNENTSAQQVVPKNEEQGITKHKYIADRSENAYYSMIDEGTAPDVKTQVSGTCWTCAISSSIEASYFKKYGEMISIDATDLCLKIYDDDKSEGWFVKGDKLEFGGWDWLGCECLSNGYEGYYLEDARHYDIEGNPQAVKDGIKTHGPISVAICDNALQKGIYDGYFTMNDNNPDHMDHEAIIIGWDDNFPKDYFRTPAKKDGAWLCQNSKSAGWGNNGTYWVSYESLLDENVIFGVTNGYKDVAYYDGGNENQISMGGTCTVANVFHKKGVLAAIGTYTKVDNEEYTIEIFDDKFEKKLASVDGVNDVEGYHVVNLSEPIEVENIAVVIHFNGPAPVEGESFELDGGRVFYKAESNEGESFVQINNEWLDLSKESTKEKLKIDFAPNNACIKALYSK